MTDQIKEKQIVSFSKKELEKEEWKDILGYEGIYQVSNLGRIRSLDRYVAHSRCGALYIKGKFLNPTYAKRVGYSTAFINEFGIKKSSCIHRVVAETFIKNPNNFEFVKHIDGNKRNNRVTNLEWFSMIESIVETYKKVKKTSEFNGIHFDKQKNKYIVVIKRKWIGQFKTEEEAINKRNQYIKENDVDFYYKTKII
jgi:hypothetical protein